MAHTDDSQNRGDLSAYDRYLAGMDTSMRQKVALTAAHLLGQGKVADSFRPAGQRRLGRGLDRSAQGSLAPLATRSVLEGWSPAVYVNWGKDAKPLMVFRGI